MKNNMVHDIEHLKIRIAKEQDAEQLIDIYAPYVLNTAITFEYKVPTVEQFRERIRAVKTRYPYIVAEIDEKIVGYAYAGPFKTRKAYDWSVETSIYVDFEFRRLGIGKLLYKELENILKMQGILNVNACIAYPSIESQYLTMDSVRFHEHEGYNIVGRFHQCGYKFNMWFDMVWMEKCIGEHKTEQPDIIEFKDIKIK